MLIGGAGDDVLLGGAGDDVLIGGPGADTIDGGPGDNVVIQGVGADRLWAQRSLQSTFTYPERNGRASPDSGS